MFPLFFTSGSHPDYNCPMIWAEPPRVVAPADDAVIVFVQPALLGHPGFAILDETGGLVGELHRRGWFAARVTPGHHLFVAKAEGLGSLSADLKAGRTYYVEVTVSMGWWEGRPQFHALGPTREGWEAVPRLLRDTKAYLVNPVRADDWTAMWKEHALSDAALEGADRRQSYPPERLERSTLRPEDGVTTPVQPQARR